MKKYVFLLAIACMLGLSAFGQDSDPYARELGARFSSVNDFNFIYKKRIEDNRYHRFGLGFVDLSGQTGEDIRVLAGGLGLSYGIEKRSPLADRLKFYCGPNITVSGSYNYANESSVGRATLRFSYILGLMYEVSDRFYLGADTAPGIGVSSTFSQGEAVLGGDIGFDSRVLAFTFAVRFPAKDKK